jgi:hypothetical protein
MAEATAKIVKIDTSKIAANAVTKDTPDGRDWHGTSEASFLVEVEIDGQVYTRKITFRIHDEKVFNIGGALTVDDVRNAILAEVDQIKSLHEVAAALAGEIDVDQVAKVKSERAEAAASLEPAK